MRLKSLLAATALVLAAAFSAQALTISSPPVTMTNSSSRVWCIVQNVGSSDAEVTGVLYSGSTGLALIQFTGLAPAGEITALIQVGDGAVGVYYCTFSYPKAAKIRGYISMTDQNDETKLIEQAK